MAQKAQQQIDQSKLEAKQLENAAYEKQQMAERLASQKSKEVEDEKKKEQQLIKDKEEVALEVMKKDH